MGESEEQSALDAAGGPSSIRSVIPLNSKLLMAGGGAMLVGSITPWVTVLFFSVSGLDTNYGVITLLAGLACAVAGYQTWKGSLFQKSVEKVIVIAALVAAIAGTTAPIYVAVEAKRSVATARATTQVRPPSSSGTSSGSLSR